MLSMNINPINIGIIHTHPTFKSDICTESHQQKRKWCLLNGKFDYRVCASNFYVRQFFFFWFFALFLRHCICQLIRLAMYTTNMNLFVLYQLNGWKAAPNFKNKGRDSHCVKRRIADISKTTTGKVLWFDNAFFFVSFSLLLLEISSTPFPFWHLHNDHRRVFAYKFENMFALRKICHHILTQYFFLLFTLHHSFAHSHVFPAHFWLLNVLYEGWNEIGYTRAQINAIVIYFEPRLDYIACVFILRCVLSSIQRSAHSTNQPFTALWSLTLAFVRLYSLYFI